MPNTPILKKTTKILLLFFKTNKHLFEFLSHSTVYEYSNFEEGLGGPEGTNVWDEDSSSHGHGHALYEMQQFHLKESKKHINLPSIFGSFHDVKAENFVDINTRCIKFIAAFRSDKTWFLRR